MAASKGDPADEARRREARDPATPVPRLEVLAGDRDPTVVVAVVANPNVPARLLAMLSRHSDRHVRSAVAEVLRPAIAGFRAFPTRRTRGIQHGVVLDGSGEGGVDAGHALAVAAPASPPEPIAVAWRWLTPAPHGVDLTAVACHGDGRVFVVGASGYLARSRDGGQTWQRLPTATRSPLAAVVITTAGRLIAVGDRALLRSDDDGDTIEVVSQAPVLGATCLWSHGATTVHAATRTGRIFTSADAGQSWSLIGHVRDAHFVALVGDGLGRAVAVADNGTTAWIGGAEAAPTVQVVPRALDHPLRAAWMSRAGRLVAVGDRGTIVEWSADHADHADHAGTGRLASGGTRRLSGVWGLADELVVVDTDGGTATTTDRGATWRRDDLRMYRGLCAIAGAAGHIVAVGAGGSVMRRSAGANAAVAGRFDHLAPLRSLWVSPAGVMVATGHRLGTVRSADGGATWTTTALGTGAHLAAIWGRGEHELYVVGDRDLVARSTDGGASWQLPGAMSPGAWLRGVAGDPAGGPVIAVGGAGRIVRLVGDQVSTPASGTAVDLHAIAVRGELAIAVGDRGTVVRSVDGGSRWTAWAVTTSDRLAGVVIDARGVIRVTTYGGAILVSADRGQSFAPVALPSRHRVTTDPWGRRPGELLFGIGRGALLWTVDDGATWREIDLGVDAEVRAVRADGRGDVHVLTEHGVVLRAVLPDAG